MSFLFLSHTHIRSRDQSSDLTATTLGLLKLKFLINTLEKLSVVSSIVPGYKIDLYYLKKKVEPSQNLRSNLTSRFSSRLKKLVRVPPSTRV